MSTPFNLMGREFAEATLEIVEPVEAAASIPLHFNPSQYKITKENSFAEIPIPGLESPPLQYVRGGAATLSLDLLVDTSDSLENVNDKYVSAIQAVQYKNSKLHAPPILDFLWGIEAFRGVLTSLDVAYLHFHDDGTPLRAQLSVVMKEYRPVEIQIRDIELESPDVEKRYVVRVGETLSSISGAVFREPRLWREIARANNIADPASLTAGTVLTIPAVTVRPSEARSSR